MNDHLEHANTVATFITRFVHDQPFASTIIVAMLLSWSVTAFAKMWMAKNDPRLRLKLWTIDIGVATAISVLMLVGLFGWRWIIAFALLFGFCSPFVYAGVTGLIGWKWPAAKHFFTLGELAPEPESPETGDDNRLPPGDTK